MNKPEISLEDFSSEQAGLNGYTEEQLLIFGLSQGKSLSGIVNMKPDEKKQLGAEFFETAEKVRKCGLLDDNTPGVDHLDTGESRKDIAEMWGNIHRKAAENLFREKIPVYDVGSLKDISDPAMLRLNTIKSVSSVLSSSIAGFKTKGSEVFTGFAQGFGGCSEAYKTEEKLRLTEGYVNYMAASVDQNRLSRDAELIDQKGFEYAPARDELRGHDGVDIKTEEKRVKTMFSAAEKFAGDVCFKGIMKYNKDLTVSAFSEAAAKAGIDSYTLQAAENVGHERAMKDAADHEVYADKYGFRLGIDREFTGSFLNRVKAEAEGERNYSADLNESMHAAYAEYERNEAEETLRLQKLDGIDIKGFFPHYTENEDEIAGYNPDWGIDGGWERDFLNRLNQVEGFYKRGSEEEAVSNVKGLVTFAALLVKKDNPDAAVNDILRHTSDYSEAKKEAGRRVLDAFLCVNERPEELGSVIADAAKAFSEINPKKEIMSMFPNEEGLDADGLKSLKNRSRVMGIMSDLSEFCTTADFVINSAVKGRNAWLPFTADTGMGDTALASAVYESARSHMSFEDQKKYADAALNKYQQERVLGVFNDCVKQMLGEKEFDMPSFAAADKAISVIMKNDKPMHSFPFEAAVEIDNTKTAAKQADSLSGYTQRDILYNGIGKNDSAKIEQKASAMETAPKKPAALSAWVSFWSKIGFYKDTVREHKAAVANYEAYMKREEAVNDADKLIKGRAAAVTKVNLSDLTKASHSGRASVRSADSLTHTVNEKSAGGAAKTTSIGK